MMYGMRPGEIQRGTRDVSSEVKLPFLQGLVRAGVYAITLLMALLLYFVIGGYGSALLLSILVWALGKYAADYLEARVKNVTLVTIIVHTQPYWFLIAGIALILVARYVLPYQWYFDFQTQRSYIVIFRVIDGAMWNDPARFPLLLRLFLGIIPVAWFSTCGLLLRRFGNEVSMPTPSMATNYAEVGFDTRQWGPKPTPAPQAQPATVTLEIVEQTANGKKVTGYRHLDNPDEVRAAFEALNSGRIPWLSRRNLRDIGVGSDVARDIMNQLKAEGFIEYVKEGVEAQLTDSGKALAEQVRAGKF